MNEPTRNPRVERATIRLANVFLPGAGFGSAAALLYVFYHYYWLHDRHFAGPAGSIALFRFAGPAYCFVFWLVAPRNFRKIKFAFVSIVLATCMVVGNSSWTV